MIKKIPIRSRYILVFFSFFFLKAISFYAQNNVVDSLRHLILKSKNDTNKAALQYNLCKEYLKQQDRIGAMMAAQQSLVLSKTFNWPKGQARAYLIMGNIFTDKAQYDKAIKQYALSLAVLKQMKYLQGIALAYNNIGNVYYYQSNFTKALAYYDTSLIIREEANDKLGLAMSYNNMGAIYKNYGSYARTLEYYFKSLKMRKELNDEQGEATSYNNIGEIYRLQGNFTKALNYYAMSLLISIKINDKPAIATSHNNMGIVFVSQKYLARAKKSFLKNIDISNEIENQHGVIQGYNNIANLYTDVIDMPDSILHEHLDSLITIKNSNVSFIRNVLLDSAQFLYERSYQLSKEIDDKTQLFYSLEGLANIKKRQNNYTDAIKYYLNAAAVSDSIHEYKEYSEACFNLFECYKQQEKYKEALLWHQKYTTAQDSVYNINNVMAGIKTELDYNYEKKESQAKLDEETFKARTKIEQEKERLIKYSLVTGFFIVLLFSFFLFKDYLQKKKDNQKIREQNVFIQNSLHEKEILIQEIHHRVKNNLQVISSMLNLQSAKTNKLDEKNALLGTQKRIESMALVHKLLFTKGELSEIDMKAYLTKLLGGIADGYSDPAKTISVNINSDSVMLNIDRAIPLGLIINEISTNAFKYAFQRKNEGVINLVFKKEETHYLFTFSDNGSGFSSDWETRKQNSLGMELIQLLNEQLNGNITCNNSSEGVSYSLTFK